MNKQYVGKDFSKNQSTDKLSPDKVRTFYIHLYIHFIFLFPGQPRTIHICSSRFISKLFIISSLLYFYLP